MLFCSVCLLKWRVLHSGVTCRKVLRGLGCILGGALSTRVRRSQRRELRKGTAHLLQRQHDVRPICENLITDPWIRRSKEIKEPSVERPWGQYQGRNLVVQHPQEPAEKKSVATKWASDENYCERGRSRETPTARLSHESFSLPHVSGVKDNLDKQQTIGFRP